MFDKTDPAKTTLALVRVGGEIVPAVLDTEDAARYVGVSTQFLKVARFKPEKKGPRYVRVGMGRGKVLYRIAALDDWLEAREVSGTHEEDVEFPKPKRKKPAHQSP